MRMTDLKKRLSENRAMTSITLRMPEDILEDLKRIAPLLGFTGYQPLMRSYIGKCLRKDLENLEADPLSKFMDALRKQGVAEDSIKKAIEEIAV